MTRVVVESPYAGDVAYNVAYAKACALDCLQRGEAPFLSHLLYPQVLNDLDGEERERGMLAGWAWLMVADKVVVYMDLGISPGMNAGISSATLNRVPVEYRRLYPLGWNRPVVSSREPE